jgi:hypothetical protein
LETVLRSGRVLATAAARVGGGELEISPSTHPEHDAKLLANFFRNINP